MNMSAEVTSNDSRESVVLQGEQSLKGVLQLQKTLEAAVAKGVSVALDVSKVTAIDTPALQLLTAFANTLHEQERELVWSGVSEPFCELVQCLGVDDQLHLQNIAINPEATTEADTGSEEEPDAKAEAEPDADAKAEADAEVDTSSDDDDDLCPVF